MKTLLTNVIFLLAFFSLFCSCKPKSDLEKALAFAGKNRPELEKVLEHYSSNPKDSLKYKAAVFLIENMPGYYSLQGEELDEFRLLVKEFALRNEYEVNEHTRILPTTRFGDKYTIPPIHRPQKIYDAHIISAPFLIENIDLAFDTWQKASWKNAVSFESFCREILPYRAGNEPLENWRKSYNDMFQPLIEKMQSKNDMVQAGQLVYDSIFNQRWLFDVDMKNEYLGAATLLETRVGDCRLIAHYATYAFRSVGIPAGIDCILQNPDMLFRQHYWNYMKDPDGKTIPFELYQTSPAYPPNAIPRKKGKVYRISFDKPESSIAVQYKGERLQALLNDPHLKDVSDAYFEGAKVSIEAEHLEGKLIFLGVFNNKTWIPITCTRTNNGKAVFQHLEPGIAWQALFYRKNRLVPISIPFISEENGKCRFLHPDNEKTQTVVLERKYPLPDWFPLFRHRSVGGLFQGANQEDFSDAVLLYTTVDSLDMRWHKVSIDNPQSFQYLRYYSAPDGHCNIAEIHFFSSGRELPGEVIGTEGTTNVMKQRTKFAAFDGDPETYFDSPSPDGAWTGLKLPKPERVSEIEFLFRTDDNSIREGDVYELFYFSEKGKVSLGKQTGTKNGVLYYHKVPSNALYWLRNETRGREERIFTYENNKQVWW